MRVRYVYSACVVIETADLRILCDPWFTPGAYDGSWYQYPVLPDPIATIGPVDIIYISHIHPDHYDPVFLRLYLARHPGARLVIGAQEPPYLANKMRVDGFRPEIIEERRLGETELLIVPSDGEGGSGVDSALAVRWRGRAVVNMNDNPFAAGQIERLLAFCPDRRVDVALLPYSGAGPYPQTFAFATPDLLAEAAARKKEQFLDLFARYLAALRPVRAMPFAGKYWLGGRLAALNRWRGVPDAIEVRERFGDRVVVLADGGQAFYDLEMQQASAERRAAYDPAEIDGHMRSRAADGYDYEREIVPLAERRLPLLPLLVAAKRRARERTRIEPSYWLALRLEGDEAGFLMNIGDDAAPIVAASAEAYAHLTPRLEIDIDARYLFGLLTRLYHWNNAEVGSQYRSRRIPGEYRPDIYRFLNMLQV